MLTIRGLAALRSGSTRCRLSSIGPRALIRISSRKCSALSCRTSRSSSGTPRARPSTPALLISTSSGAVADGRGELLDRVLRRDVELVDVVGQLPQLVGLGRAAAAGPHLVAALGVDPGELQPEPAVGPGDDDPLASRPSPSSRRASVERRAAVARVDQDRRSSPRPGPRRRTPACRRGTRRLPGARRAPRRRAGRPADRASGSRSRRRR